MIRHLRWVSIAAAVILSGCHAIVLDPRGPVGMAQKTILIDSLVIMLAIVIPTIIATLAFAWWFRASNSKAQRLPDWSFSGSIELVVWAIPCMVIILLGGVTWIGSHELDPAKPLTSETPPLDIEVVSLDWQWLFIYPHQGVAIVNQLVVPAGTPLHFSLTSASVMNTFFIPQLGSMIYTMNGMATQLNLQANESGTFRGMSAHYSGEGFSDMHFDVHALPAAEFAAWVSRTRSENNVLDAKRYAALSRPTIAAPVALFGKVEPGLFAKIVALHLPPAPGPLAADDDAHRAQHAVQ